MNAIEPILDLTVSQYAILTWMSMPLSHSLVPCSLNTYSNWIGSGDGTCTACAPGYVTGVSDLGASSCTICPLNTYSTNSSTVSCTSCPAGYITTSVGATACTACPVNTYANDTSVINCTRCINGTSTNGMAGASACGKCVNHHSTY